ncbi:glycosyltransferase, partial [Acidisphaera sp. L21]|uniref:glycosyltransferase n=1 Tax=Acidisphaera sp. L21 TaxID=1641851 RepID=UPI00131B8BCA
PGLVPYDDHIRLLQRSDVHTYLSYPFIASWSLREALACGCAIVAADTPAVAEFLTDGDNAAVVPPLDPIALARQVGALLADDALRQRLGAGARRFAEQALRMEDHIAGYEALIQAVLAR